MPFYEFEGKSPTIDPTAWIAPSSDIIAANIASLFDKLNAGHYLYVFHRLVL